MRRNTIANYVSPATAINRLLKLAALIRDEVPKRQFDIESFRCNIYNKKLKPAKDIKIGCDTAGCIAGWGVVVAPELRFNYKNDIVNDRFKNHGIRNVRSFGAAFGLTELEAYKLCLRDFGYKKTPKKAAQAVDDLAADLAEYHGYDIVKTDA